MKFFSVFSIKKHVLFLKFLAFIRQLKIKRFRTFAQSKLCKVENICFRITKMQSLITAKGAYEKNLLKYLVCFCLFVLVICYVYQCHPISCLDAAEVSLCKPLKPITRDNAHLSISITSVVFRCC